MRAHIPNVSEERRSAVPQRDNCKERQASHDKALQALDLPWPARSLERRQAFQELYQLFYKQVLHGCCNPVCSTPTCATSRKRRSKGPFRPFTTSTARGIAIELVSGARLSTKLCPDIRSLSIPIHKSHSKQHPAHPVVTPRQRTSLATIDVDSHTVNALLIEGKEQIRCEDGGAISSKHSQEDLGINVSHTSAMKNDDRVNASAAGQKQQKPGDTTSLGKQLFSSAPIALLNLPPIPRFWKRDQHLTVGGNDIYHEAENLGLEIYEHLPTVSRESQWKPKSCEDLRLRRRSAVNGRNTDSGKSIEHTQVCHDTAGDLRQIQTAPLSEAHSGICVRRADNGPAHSRPIAPQDVFIPFTAVKSAVRESCLPIMSGRMLMLSTQSGRCNHQSDDFWWPKIRNLISHVSKGDRTISRFYDAENLGRTDFPIAPLRCGSLHKASTYDDVVAISQHLSNHLSPFENLARHFPASCGIPRNMTGRNEWNHVLSQAFAVFHGADFFPATIFTSLWQVSKIIHQPLRSSTGELSSEGGSDACSQVLHCGNETGLSMYGVIYVSQVIFAALIGFILPTSFEIPREFLPAQKLRQGGHVSFPMDLHKSPVDSTTITQTLVMVDKFDDEMGHRLVRSLCTALTQVPPPDAHVRHTCQLSNDQTTPFDVIACTLVAKHLFIPGHDNKVAAKTCSDVDDVPFYLKTQNGNPLRYLSIVVEWLRGIVLEDWHGQEEIKRHSALGGALQLLSSIYDHHADRGLPAEILETKFVSDGLDIIEMPKRWIGFHDSNKHHILDFPFLFRPSILVSYFRAVNHATMTEAYRDAMSNSHMARRLNFGSDPYDSSKEGYLRLGQRLKRLTEPYLTLDIRRDSILTDAFNQLWRRQKRELLRPLKVRLGYDEGEEGSDHGGVQQEFFRIVVAEALDPKYGAFKSDPVNHMTWFQPGSFEPLYKFELLGLLVSLAIYNGITLPITFPIALYKKLLGCQTDCLEDIEDGWPDLAKGLRALRDWTDGDVEDVFCRSYMFSVDVFGSTQDFNLDSTSESTSSDVPMVTNANRDQYIRDYVRQLLTTSISQQYEAFARGVKTVIEPKSLHLFTPAALKTLIEGKPHIDIHKLEKVTRYEDDYNAEHRSIRDFWSIVHEWASPSIPDGSSTSEPWTLAQDQLDAKEAGQAKVRRLLEFVTASDRLPVGGEDRVAFVVQRYGSDEQRLPGSMTCFGRLLLPEYSTKEVMKEKLEQAIEHAKGFGQA